MSRASGQVRPGVHRFSGTAPGAMARMFAAWSPGAPHKQPTACARKVLLNRHLLERPSPEGFPGRRAVSSQLEPHAGPILTGRALGVP